MEVTDMELRRYVEDRGNERKERKEEEPCQ